MSVVYSIGAKVGGGGIGRTASYAVEGLYKQGLLAQLLCGSFVSMTIPEDMVRSFGLASRALQKLAVYDRSRRVRYLERVLYDRWAARRLPPGNVFHVWNSYGLSSLKRAKDLGMLTSIERASSHPQYQDNLLRKEHLRWGIPYRHFPRLLQRSIAELNAADCVLVPSDFVESSFLAQGFPPEKLLKIPFGVDVQIFQPLERKPSMPFRVLFVGTVGLRKGVIYLLEAWKRLGWKDAILDLAGKVDPDFLPLLEKYRDVPGIRRYGYVRSPVGLFQQADLFAFPSLEEGSALVTYQAMACGLPLVTTANAGSVVREGQDGFIVPVMDIETLAGRLEELRAKDRLREKMGEHARQRALEFTWEKYGQRLGQAFNLLRVSPQR